MQLLAPFAQEEDWFHPAFFHAAFLQGRDIHEVQPRLSLLKRDDVHGAVLRRDCFWELCSKMLGLSLPEQQTTAPFPWSLLRPLPSISGGSSRALPRFRGWWRT